MVDTKNISAALRCSIINGIVDLNKKLFLNNPLIKAEKEIVETENYFLSLPLQERSSDEILHALNVLHSSIEKQEIFETSELFNFFKSFEIKSYKIKRELITIILFQIWYNKVLMS